MSDPKPTRVMDRDISGRGSARARRDTEVMRREPQSHAWLVVTSGRREGDLHRLSGHGTVVGSDSAQSDLLLDDPRVSGMHAKVRAEGEANGKPAFFIQDLMSTNSTLVNNEQISRHALTDHDRIRMGDTDLVFLQL